ncbi:hypothetical protein JCM16303_000573 [Sporobolomyces ruberrimus]
METLGALSHFSSKTSMSLLWNIEKANDLLAQQPFPTIYSPTFDNGRWQLKLAENMSGEHQGKIGVTVMAIRTEEDVQMATSNFAWSRPRSWTTTITGKLVLKCEMSDKGNDETPTYRAANPLGTLIFDNPEYADVCFVFPAKNTRPERRIFASKAILAQSCTYFKNGEYPLLELIGTIADASDPETIPDEDYMGALDWIKATATTPAPAPGVAATEDSKAEPTAVDETENDSDLSELDTTPEAKRRAEEEDPVTDGKEGAQPESEPREKKRRRTCDVEEEQSSSKGNLRQMRRVDVPALFSMHQFTAFRAFLSYLHTGLLPIAALPSDYLVARDIAHEKHIAAMPDQTGTRDASPPEAFTFPPRGEWLRNRFHELRGQPDWKGIEPCSAHALHRVADALGCAEVEDIAISRIARSLSTANVAYELMSPLCANESQDLEDAIFPFFRKHYETIKDTSAWSTVLDHLYQGDLGAGIVFNRIF